MPKQVKKLAFDEFIGLPSTENIKDPETKRILDHYAMAIRWMWERMPRYYKEYEFQVGEGIVLNESEKLGWSVQGGQAIAKKIKHTVKIGLDPKKVSDIMAGNSTYIDTTNTYDGDTYIVQEGVQMPSTTLGVVTQVTLTGDGLYQTKRNVTVLGTGLGVSSKVASVSDCPEE